MIMLAVHIDGDEVAISEVSAKGYEGMASDGYEPDSDFWEEYSCPLSKDQALEYIAEKIDQELNK